MTDDNILRVEIRWEPVIVVQFGNTRIEENHAGLDLAVSMHHVEHQRPIPSDFIASDLLSRTARLFEPRLRQNQFEGLAWVLERTMQRVRNQKQLEDRKREEGKLAAAQWKGATE